MPGGAQPGPQRPRMLAGEPYLASDPELVAGRRRAAALCERFNRTGVGEREAVLRELLGSFGPDAEILPPFHCDYGDQIAMGARSFANFGFIVLDAAPVVIGDDVLIGPAVQLLTSTHPTHPAERRTAIEAAEPIAIGDNAWLGGGVIVCPGVTIGADAVIGAGAVVVRDVPAGAVAVGNPARVVRQAG